MVFLTMLTSFAVRRLRLLRYFFFTAALCLEISLITFAIGVFFSEKPQGISPELDSVSYIASRENTPKSDGNSTQEGKSSHVVGHSSSGSTRIVTDLCIEPVKDNSLSHSNKSWSLVAYNQPKDLIGKIGKIWEVEYRTEKQDSGNMNDHPAFFISSKNLRKVHVLLLLYQMLERANKLNATIPSMVYFDIPEENETEFNGSSKGITENDEPFEDLVLHLSIREDFGTFPNQGDTVCYQRAIFAQETLYPRLCPNHRLTHYLIRSYNLNFNCGKKSRPTITFIQRKTRRILNIEKLQEISKHYGDPQLVTFENLTIAEQLHVAYCADILVGVHGVGMDWAPLMKYNSSVLEVAWNSKGAASLHSPRYQGCPGINVHPIGISGFKENWNAFAAFKHLNEDHMSEQQKKVAYEKDEDLVWLTADVTVDTEEFGRRLKIITSRKLH